MKTTYELLLVEDNPGDARLVREMLAGESRARVELEHAPTLKDALRRLEERGFDAVLIDLGLPDSDGIETFTRLHTRFPGMPAIVLTGNDDLEMAVRAVQEGAQDYLIKSEVTGSPLVRAVQYAIERKKADEALRRSEATLRGFYESAPMMMGTVELTGDDEIIHLFDNPATARFFGARYRDTAEKNAHELGVPDHAIAAWAEHYREGERLGRPVSFEYLHGNAREGPWLSVHVAPLGRGPSGRMQFSYVAEDVTERKLAEEEARHRNVELRRRYAEIERFNRFATGRELRMMELKQEVNALCRELGRPDRYADLIEDAHPAESVDVAGKRIPEEESLT